MGFVRPLKQPAPAAKSDQPTEPASARQTSFSPRLLRKLALENAWKQPIGELIKGIWGIIRPHRMLINARIGFTEPHYTGWLIALAGILQGLNNSYCIQVEGVWDEPCLEGALTLAGRLVLAQLLWHFFKFLLKPEIRSAYRLIRTRKNPSPKQAAA